MQLTNTEPVLFSAGGHNYRHRLLGSKASLELTRDIMAMIGPAVGMLLGSAGTLAVNMDALMSAELTPEVAAKAVESFVTRASSSKLHELMALMVGRTEVQVGDDDGTGAPAFVPLTQRYEGLFSGKPKAQLAFLVAAVKENAADFFD